MNHNVRDFQRLFRYQIEQILTFGLILHAKESAPSKTCTFKVWADSELIRLINYCWLTILSTSSCPARFSKTTLPKNFVNSLKCSEVFVVTKRTLFEWSRPPTTGRLVVDFYFLRFTYPIWVSNDAKLNSMYSLLAK